MSTTLKLKSSQGSRLAKAAPPPTPSADFRKASTSSAQAMTLSNTRPIQDSGERRFVLFTVLRFRLLHVMLAIVPLADVFGLSILKTRNPLPSPPSSEVEILKRSSMSWNSTDAIWGGHDESKSPSLHIPRAIWTLRRAPELLKGRLSACRVICGVFRLKRPLAM